MSSTLQPQKVRSKFFRQTESCCALDYMLYEQIFHINLSAQTAIYKTVPVPLPQTPLPR